MRRAVIRVLRTAKCARVGNFLLPVRPIAVTVFQRPSYVGVRSGSSFRKDHGPRQNLQSAMYLRQFAAAAIASVVATGVWYYRGESNVQGDLANSPTTTHGLPSNIPCVNPS